MSAQGERDGTVHMRFIEWAYLEAPTIGPTRREEGML